MTEYKDVRTDWFALLHFHLKVHGTRPHLGTDDGEVWDDAEFAKACGTGDPHNPRNASRSVMYWSQTDPVKRRVRPNHIKSIEAALMGKNKAFDPPASTWRRDLRAAHAASRGKKKQRDLRTSLTNAVADAPRSLEGHVNEAAFSHVMAKRFLLKIRGKVFITPDFLASISRKCRDRRFIATVTSPRHKPYHDEPFTTTIFIKFLVPTLKKERWDIDTLTLVINETVVQLHKIFAAKALEVGLYESRDGNLKITNDALEAFAANWIRNPKAHSSEHAIYLSAYEAWRNVAEVAVISTSGEDHQYIEILAILMFGSSYENGSLQKITRMIIDADFGA